MVANYLTFLKFRAHAHAAAELNDTQLAELYAEFAEDGYRGGQQDWWNPGAKHWDRGGGTTSIRMTALQYQNRYAVKKGFCVT